MSSVKTVSYISIGIVLLLVLTIGFGGYIMSLVLEVSEDAKIQAERNSLAIQDLRQKVIPKLDKNYEQQVITEHNILTNLTTHRKVTNFTRDLLIDYISQFNATNEKGRISAVNQIVTAINNHIDKLVANGTIR